ncbi:MAG: hypothetical protein Q8Q09_05150 [Deltaproteobacteria bacterium]|nr:hypothetical protein [Deltaproteobacteria bacterium]
MTETDTKAPPPPTRRLARWALLLVALDVALVLAWTRIPARASVGPALALGAVPEFALVSHNTAHFVLRDHGAITVVTAPFASAPRADRFANLAMDRAQHCAVIHDGQGHFALEVHRDSPANRLMIRLDGVPTLAARSSAWRCAFEPPLSTLDPTATRTRWLARGPTHALVMAQLAQSQGNGVALLRGLASGHGVLRVYQGQGVQIPWISLGEAGAQVPIDGELRLDALVYFAHGIDSGWIDARGRFVRVREGRITNERVPRWTTLVARMDPWMLWLSLAALVGAQCVAIAACARLSSENTLRVRWLRWSANLAVLTLGAIAWALWTFDRA